MTRRRTSKATPTPYGFGDFAVAHAYGRVANEYETFRKQYGDFEANVQCPYCGSSVNNWTTSEKREDSIYYDLGLGEAKDITLTLCPSCSWFRYKVLGWLTDDQGPAVTDVVATMGKESWETNAAPFVELEQHLAKKWGDRKELSSARAEELVAAIFRDHLNCEVIYTTNGVYAPDGGIDFVLINSDTGLTYAFQVKRRLVDSPERVHQIREFIGSVASSHYQHAYYVTTAEKFTQAMRAEADKSSSNLKSRNIELNLVDARRLRSLLKEKSLVPTTVKKIRQLFRSDSVWNGKLTLEAMISTAFQTNPEGF